MFIFEITFYLFMFYFFIWILVKVLVYFPFIIIINEIIIWKFLHNLYWVLVYLD